MLTISAPSGSRKAEEYFEEELVQERSSSSGKRATTYTCWEGKLAHEFGLSGAVDALRFKRLARGRDPRSDEVLVRQTFGRSRGTKNDHRAIWDLTFSAPKTVSITAILGGDERIRELHREAVRAALSQVEYYAHAHLGGTRGRERTGNLAIACFEHDNARPVDGRADVQLHTHAITFNMTRASDKIRSLEPRELFRSQRFATAVYRAHLAAGLLELGYAIEIDPETGAPEIAGYTAEYREAASQRSQQIDANVIVSGYRRNARSANVAVRIGRGRKGTYDAETIRAGQLDLARRYGDQHLRVVAAMRRRGPIRMDPPRAAEAAARAVEFALEECTERDAVTDVRRVLEVALTAELGRTSKEAVYDALWRAIKDGRIVRVANRRSAATGITTREMIELERRNIQFCLSRQGCGDSLFAPSRLVPLIPRMRELSVAQMNAFRSISEQRDQIHVLQGYAGVGKTRLLRVVAAAARLHGFEVVGLAPSGTARDSLAEGDIESETLQKFLLKRGGSGRPRLLILDEASLASTRQVADFLSRLLPTDRVLVVGDRAQHESVDAGRMFGQLQDAGLNRTVLEEIRRQQDPELRQAVTHLAHGEVIAALAQIAEERIHEIKDREERFRAIADEYCRSPDGSVVIAPTHEERFGITRHVRAGLHAQNFLGPDVEVVALDARNDVTEASRRKARAYRVGDVVRYRTGSKVYRLDPGSYARVTGIDVATNTLVVETASGRPVIYDPERVTGVEIYRERKRSFATGDRVVITRGHQTRRIPKGATGTIVDLAGTRARIRLDRGGETTLDLAEWRHVDHAYAMTSHSSQSISAGRVLINVDSTLSEAMVNDTFAYVATSRAVREAVFFTDRRDLLEARLGREHGNRSALDALHALQQQPAPAAEPIAPGMPIATQSEPRAERREGQEGPPKPVIGVSR